MTNTVAHINFIKMLLGGILCIVGLNLTHAQSSNRQYALITNDTVLTLDNYVAPESLLWADGNNHDDQVHVSGKSIIVNQWDIGDSLLLSFRTLPNFFESQKVDWTSMQSPANIQLKKDEAKSFDLINREGLDYQGSFGRGVQIGNRQSLLLNSEFNLQLAGKLGDDVEVLGAISDNAIPIQPEGDTRRLEEFDKVFLQITKGPHKIVAGDFQLNAPTGYFLQYLKKLSGLQYVFQDSLNKDWQMESSTSFAASRGKFSRNILDPKEGTQGPYQLTGSEGERFLVILAGTERIYWDGELLERGADADYIIDYNQGQVTFSYNRLVNQNLRIIVEFEYIERNYGRSNTTANLALSNRTSQVFVNLYHHRDSKSPSGVISDSLSQQILRNAGDDQSLSVIPGDRPATQDDVDRVRYITKDTSYMTSSGRVDTTIFVFRENPNEAEALIVKFSNVGQDNGHYILSQSNSNGRVYQWVSPSQDGQPQGSYTPSIPITAPESLSILTIGGTHSFTSYLKASGEFLLSQEDQNRLSGLNDNDNQGLGAKGQLSLDYPLNKKWSLRSTLGQEWIQEEVRVINPFRKAEFARDWNYVLDDFKEERLRYFDVGLNNLKNKLTYSLSNFHRGDVYEGWQHAAHGLWEKRGWKVESKSSWSTIADGKIDATFMRPHISVSKSFEKGKRGAFIAEWRQEDNKQKLLDSLDQRSFRFDEWTLKWKGPDSGVWATGLETKQRTDYLPAEGLQKLASQATDVSMNARFQPHPQFRIGVNAGWRNFEAYDSILTQSPSRNTLIARVDQAWRWKKNAVELQTIYEVSSGQEPLLEFVFEERRPGEGNYIFEDLNDDGIPQINEFISAPFVDTARFVRIQLINNNFTTTNNLLFSQNIKINPYDFWESNAPKWLKRLQWSTLVKTNSKTRADQEWNPYRIEAQDSLNMIFTTLQQHNIFINRGSPKFDLHLSYRLNSTGNNLISGQESQNLEEFRLRSRYNLWKTAEIILTGGIGKQQNASQFFSERRYVLDKVDIGSGFNWVWNKALRVLAQLNYFETSNTVTSDGEELRQASMNLNVSYRKSRNFNAQISFGYDKVNYQSTGNQVLDFAILQERRDGDNYSWSTQIDQMLFSNVQMSLRYTGRKNGIGRTIHQGQASIKANF